MNLVGSHVVLLLILCYTGYFDFHDFEIFVNTD
jgi:hypothetical protein